MALNFKRKERKPVCKDCLKNWKNPAMFRVVESKRDCWSCSIAEDWKLQGHTTDRCEPPTATTV